MGGRVCTGSKGKRLIPQEGEDGAPKKQNKGGRGRWQKGREIHMLILLKKYSEVSSVLQGCSQSTCLENKGCWCADVKEDAVDGAKDGAICLQ